jgi:hypothetical protein
MTECRKHAHQNLKRLTIFGLSADFLLQQFLQVLRELRGDDSLPWAFHRPRDSPSTGFDSDATLSKYGITSSSAILRHVSPTTMAPARVELDPFTSDYSELVFTASTMLNHVHAIPPPDMCWF